jgi:tRNA1(Val) A37 N6-methylase TrmN6
VATEAGPPASPDPLTDDAFLGGRLRLWQPARGFRSGMDAVLLAAAVPARPGESALDLGCGAGAAALALGARVGGMALAGLEAQPAYAALARANAARNGIALEVIEGDVAAPPAVLRGRAFDHVLMNPPFFDRAASSRAADPGRDLAQGGDAPLALWLALAARRLRPGGRLAAIHRAEGLPALLAALPAAMGSVLLRPLAPRQGRAARNILLLARKGGRAPFRLLAPLVLHAASRHARDGEDLTPQARAVFRDGAALPWD